MITIGSTLPSFSLQTHMGNTVTQADFLGKKLVVFFYPKAGTPTCTVEAKNFRDHYEELQSEGYIVLGVSSDSVTKLNNWHCKHEFPYLLLSDENHTLAEAFGVWKEKKNFGKTYMGIVRMTFIFDEQGVCTRVIEKVKSAEAVQQILKG